MDQKAAIKAMEAHSREFKLKLTTIGQMAVNNRNAHERLKKGTAQISTVERILDWIEKDRASRAARKATGSAA